MKLDPAVLTPLREFGGDDLVWQLFQTFVDHAPSRLEGLRSAVDSRDVGELTRAVHSLRSSSAMLGAMELSELAGTLEELADAGRVEELVARTPELERQVSDLVALLEDELESSREG